MFRLHLLFLLCLQLRRGKKLKPLWIMCRRSRGKAVIPMFWHVARCYLDHLRCHQCMATMIHPTEVLLTTSGGNPWILLTCHSHRHSQL
ncbi:unnamed protein product [Cylicostephanus goldi]|uniref:Secreted protein n=1 Tax=Cylicostephanus goldi TaxID=71465 RepID=A0A3P6RUV7_CYLGO|nr:unnamed protein product [Cylicostephanus goldi]